MRQPRIILPRIVVRERRATARFRARLEPQHARWEVGKYADRFLSGPGTVRGRGRVWRPRLVGEQHNLLLDVLWDDLMAQHPWDYLNYYAAVGTGTSTPSSTQTQLDNEVARVYRNAPGYPSPYWTRPSDGVYDIERWREFQPPEVGGQNLTEWGFSPGAGSTQLMVRELFRDSGGNPTVVSVAADEYLRLYHKYRLTLGPTPAISHTMNITGIGNVPGKIEIRAPTSDFDDLKIMSIVARGYDISNSDFRFGVIKTTVNIGYNETLGSSEVAGYRVSDLGASYSSYTSGDRQRSVGPMVISPSQGNMTHYGYMLTFGNLYYYSLGGIFFIIDSGYEFTKDSDHKLTLDPITVSWGP